MVYGLCILIPILYFAREKFSYKLAFIFLINNIYGPDIVFLFSFIDPGFHSIIGFIIAAIPLSLVYSYISRFSMEKSEGKFPLSIIDGGIREVKWLNAFFATVAGGISHFFIDQFFHWELEMMILPGLSFTLEEMLSWSGELYHTMNPIMVIGELIVVLIIIFSLFYLRKGYKETLIVFISATVLSVILMLFSTEIYGGEREYAVIVSCIVYFLIPLFLLFYAARDILDNPNKIPDKKKLDIKVRYNIVATVSLILGLVMLTYGIVAISMSDMLVDLIGGLAVATQSQLEILGYYYGSISAILVIGSIGLFFRNNFCRYLVIFASIYFLILGFPLGIAFFLNEKEVKELFRKKTEE